MSPPVVLRLVAEMDIEDAHDAMEQAHPGRGRRFVARVREALERIERMPEMYGIVWEDVRAARLKKFPHVIYYRVLEDRVEVLAVLHGSRDASAWRSRVTNGEGEE